MATKREMFETMVEVFEGMGETELAEFASKELALVVKRAEAPRKPSKEQIANVERKERIVAMLRETPGMTATEVGDGLGETVQRASALLKQLRDEGLVTRTEAKGKVKATFAVAG